MKAIRGNSGRISSGAQDVVKGTFNTPMTRQRHLDLSGRYLGPISRCAVAVAMCYKPSSSAFCESTLVKGRKKWLLKPTPFMFLSVFNPNVDRDMHVLTLL